MQKENWLDKIITGIEQEKEDRTKYIILFSMSLTSDEKKRFRKGLKSLINDISGSHKLNN